MPARFPRHTGASLVMVAMLIGIPAVAVPSLAAPVPDGPLAKRFGIDANGVPFTLWDYVLRQPQGIGPGDFFTIYDFAGYVPGLPVLPPGTLPYTQPPGWTSSAALLTPPPPGITVNDDPTWLNITWTRTGGTITDSADVGTFYLSTTAPSMGLERLDDYVVSVGPTATSGQVYVPVPEPTAAILIAISPLLAGRRRAR